MSLLRRISAVKDRLYLCYSQGTQLVLLCHPDNEEMAKMAATYAHPKVLFTPFGNIKVIESTNCPIDSIFLGFEI